MKEKKEKRISCYVTEEQYEIMSAMPSGGITAVVGRLVEVVEESVKESQNPMRTLKRIACNQGLTIKYED